MFDTAPSLSRSLFLQKYRDVLSASETFPSLPQTLRVACQPCRKGCVLSGFLAR